MQAIDAGDLELGRRLDSYARFRLSPDSRAAARIRARVMREARLQHDTAWIIAHETPSPAALASRRPVLRRLAMPFLAATVWLGIAVGSISAAQAGGPLYSTRLWIETATLPAGGPSRAQAELARLDARLGEAMSGAARGDQAAVTAALDAYGQIADETTAWSIGDARIQALVAVALDEHVSVLTAVAARLGEKGNATAEAAIEVNIQRTIDHNAAVIQKLDAKAGNGSGSGGAGGSGGGAGNGGGSGGGAGNGGSGGGNGGGPAVKPDPTPRPTPDKPDHTPKGQNQ